MAKLVRGCAHAAYTESSDGQDIPSHQVVVLGDGEGNLLTSASGAVKTSSAAGASVQNSGTHTAPAAGQPIATVTIPATGLWSVTASYFLSGAAPGSGDADNMQIQQNTEAALVLALPPVQNLFPQPSTVVLECAAGDTVSVNAVGAGTAGLGYYATLVAEQVG